MPERYARITALILIVVLIIALPLLISLFGSLNRPAATPEPTLQVAAVPPTGTSAPPTGTATLPPPSETPTTVVSPSPTASCPIPATPEPLWVNPVLSPTNQLSQAVSVTLGRGREITITGEGGTVTQAGEFSTAQPVELQVTLAPNTENHLVVTGKVEYAADCFYTLETRLDRVGNPLVIVQSSTLTPPPPTLALTPAPGGTVYVKPFTQVFALNQDTPSSNDQLWLYTDDTNGAFQVVTQQGAFTHLLSQGGTLNFWTLNGNIATTPPPAPTYDTSVSGQPVEFVSSTVFGCEAQYPRPLILGMCSDLQNVANGEVVQRATVDGTVLYLVRINNHLYWVSSNVLKAEP